MADGSSVRDLVPENDFIRLIEIEPGRSIGEKRNFGASHALGEIIAHWDDDDYSAPDRLADQIGRLRESGLSVTGYFAMLFTDGKRWWRYAGHGGYAVGTSLCYHKSWWSENQFRPKQVGEDGVFVTAAREHHQLVTADARLLMAATIHVGNTSPRQLRGGDWNEVLNFPGIHGLEIPTP